MGSSPDSINILFPMLRLFLNLLDLRGNLWVMRSSIKDSLCILSPPNKSSINA
jgi:hypothetical protein